MPPMTKRYPFYVGITTLIVTIVISLTGLFLWISHRESKAAALQMADRLFSEVNQKTMQRYESALEAVAVLAGSATRMPGMASPPVGGGLSHPGMGLMLEALAFYDFLFSTYVGYADGSFIQLVAVRDRADYRRVTDAMLDYARPLVQGEAPIKIDNGLPVYMRFDRKPLEKKLPEYM